MKVTVVMPAYNAEKTVIATYQAIPHDVVDEIILVDDASQDNTVTVAKTLPDMIVLQNQTNQQYGGNQKVCYDEALSRGADIIIMVHPDLQYDPTYIPPMIDLLRTGQADMVLGSRFLNQDPRRQGMVWWRYWGNRFLSFCQNQILKTQLSEWHTGYRAYTAQMLRQMPYQKFANSFGFDSEFLIAAVRRGFRVKEVAVPTRYAADSSSISFTNSVKYGLDTLAALRDSK